MCLDARQAFLAGLVGLLTLAMLPAVFGGRSAVVVSGSMAPAVRPGDVVLAMPVARTANARPAAGKVVVVADPVRPGSLLMHRLIKYDDESRMILKGDANQVADSIPVPLKDLKGVAKVRIPYIGLPYLWVEQRSYLSAAAAALVVLLIAAWRPRRRG